MMTCKDCKKNNICFGHYDENDKSINVVDICSCFESKHKTRYVSKHGYHAMQLGQTFDVIIYNNIGAVLYSKKCSHKISRFALRKILDKYLRKKEND